jgi:hypothetical protein
MLIGPKASGRAAENELEDRSCLALAGRAAVGVLEFLDEDLHYPLQLTLLGGRRASTGRSNEQLHPGWRQFLLKCTFRLSRRAMLNGYFDDLLMQTRRA